MTPAGYFLYNEEYKEWEETHAGTPNSVPLYTNLAELTDEEIIILWNDLVDRTILRKAQEKC